MSGGRTTALALVLTILALRLALSGRLRATYGALLGPPAPLGLPLSPGLREPSPLPAHYPPPTSGASTARGTGQTQRTLMTQASLLDVVLGIFEA